MKRALVLMCAVVLLFSIIGCRRDDGIVVWSFSDEVAEMINDFYLPAHPDVRLSYSFTPSDQFENRLDPVLASGRGVPDVFVLESAFVRKYVESGLMLDLTDVYQRNSHKLLSYPAEVGSHNGRVYAMSWQAAPGAFFYRRSIARRYFGNDDPAFVQTLLSDVDRFIETAARLRQASNGRAVILASREDLFYPFADGRAQPWVVNGRLYIDPVMNQLMDLARLVHENRYDGRVGQWSPGWFAAMNDALRDEAGNQIEAFGYFLPTWGLHYVLKQNAPDTTGDWAMVAGPFAYRWGGTWLGAYRGTQHADAAKHLIEWLTTDDGFLERWALHTGDLTANLNVTNKIKYDFVEPFLGGQNHYVAFAEMALNVDGRLAQGTDQTINGLFQEAITAYVEGEKTRQEAIDDFRLEIEIRLGL
jgi:ABC-type glycerol-3-phosphate transport system substrate-binding protein